MIITFALVLRALIIYFFLLCASNVVAQNTATRDTILDKYIELNGVVMTADSLRYVPFASITSSMGLNELASEMGVFSIMVLKGDTLHFNSPGFRTVDYVISKNLAGTRYSILQLMVQDTFYLAETIFRPAPTKEQFDYAFKYTHVPDDKYELARKNTEEQAMRIYAETLRRDGAENQAAYKRMAIERQSWVGMQPPQRIFSPLAWADFITAWKRGDFKKKKTTKKSYRY